MKKQIIVISDVVSTLPNVLTVSLDQFFIGSYKNAYVLVDRGYVTTKQIYQIKDYCQYIGLNPLLDGSYMDVSYVFIPDWQAESIEQAYETSILEAIRYLEESEIERKLYELNDCSTLSKVAKKLLTLAACPASPFGEKRNAINAAYKMVFGIKH